MALSSLFFLSVFLHHLIISVLLPEAFPPRLTQVNPMEPTLTLHDTVLILLMLYCPRMLFPLSPKGSFLYSPLSSYIVSFKTSTRKIYAFSFCIGDWQPHPSFICPLVLGLIVPPGIFPAWATPLSHFSETGIGMSLLLPHSCMITSSHLPVC